MREIEKNIYPLYSKDNNSMIKPHHAKEIGYIYGHTPTRYTTLECKEDYKFSILEYLK